MRTLSNTVLTAILALIGTYMAVFFVEFWCATTPHCALYDNNFITPFGLFGSRFYNLWEFFPGVPLSVGTDGVLIYLYLLLESLWVLSFVLLLLRLLRTKIPRILVLSSAGYIAAVILILVALTQYSHTARARSTHLTKLLEIRGADVNQQAFDCEIATGTAYDQCIMQQIQGNQDLARNIALCGNMSEREFRNHCRTEIAAQQGAMEICDTLEGDPQLVGVPHTDQYFPGPSPADCLEIVRGFPTLSKPGLDILAYCDSFPSWPYDIICFSRAAALNQDEHICEQQYVTEFTEWMIHACREISKKEDWRNEVSAQELRKYQGE
ncbi:MAG: hypothetical protein Q7R81_03510 [Candidatus Peregrinibacteria bacterium]|nr:hypothetical protein [Candidatus Peregrinibacteria bacterium]